ncbi:MAG: hypothetical protein R2911_09470 [Caldilineaceae bacterium]
MASNQELIERWQDEPAPLLPLLHAFFILRWLFIGRGATRHQPNVAHPAGQICMRTVTFYHTILAATRQPQLRRGLYQAGLLLRDWF